MTTENEVKDYELRVYGISETYIKERDDLVDITSLENQDITDDEWVDQAERFGYISTLNTFIHNVNRGLIAKVHSNLRFRVIPFGRYLREKSNKEKVTDIVPKNKLHYILRY